MSVCSEKRKYFQICEPDLYYSKVKLATENKGFDELNQYRNFEDLIMVDATKMAIATVTNHENFYYMQSFLVFSQRKGLN